jgi:Zn-dependent M28 family amino/carboxypeptidase
VQEPVVLEEPPPDVFSAQRAWADLLALEALGPRWAGSEAADRARTLIAERLAEVGLPSETVETAGEAEGPGLRHVVATLPGASTDLVLLVAPFDSGRYADVQFLGTNDGASGAALLIELGRVLTTRALPYTVRLVFLEGEGATLEGERFAGSAAYAAALDASEELDRIRLLVAFNQVCDADLQIARDLQSHRMHREEFFRTARLLGSEAAFPLDLGFESVAASHTAFGKRGVRPVVALADTRFGGTEIPGFYAATADDNHEHCAAESLETVGLVSLEALDAIGRRLAKIDRFTSAPLAPLETAPSPPAEESLPPAPDETGGEAAAESVSPAPSGAEGAPAADSTPPAPSS